MGAPQHVNGDRGDLEKLYLEVVGDMRDHSIQGFFSFCLRENKDVWEKFLTSPGARSENPGHHAFEGGLAYHTLTAAKLAGQIVKHYQSLGMAVKRDIVVAGVVLHDIGKAFCYEWKEESIRGDRTVDAGYVHTRVSKLHHHIPIGYNWFLREAERFNCHCRAIGKPELTEKKINHIAHIILSHHGRRSWSSPVTPQTIEAYIVHVVEMMDAFVDKYNKGQDVRDLYDH